jgi:hypothetical protein
VTAIKKASDLYDHSPDLPYEDATTILEIKRRGGLSGGVFVPDPEPEQGGDPIVVARVDWGRWVGDCNLWDAAKGWTCRGAQAVDPDDPRFFCIACHNAAVGGRWRPVTWPADIAAVEAPLEALPVPEQNWTP